MRHFNFIQIIGTLSLLLAIAIAFVLGWKLLSPSATPLTAVPLSPLLPSVAPVPQSLTYERRQASNATVHILTIPATSGYEVTVASVPTVATLESFAQQHEAIAVLNGGYFDPTNQQSTSFVTMQGRLIDDPRMNQRLMQNPDLIPYLAQILDRTEFRRYRCSTATRYDIALHSDAIPDHCQFVDAIGAGPRLLPTLALEAEGFVETVNGRLVRDPLGSQTPNARSAIGITANGDVIWVMVAQQPEAPTTSGLSLADLAELMKQLGADVAMNLDGGSSASLYYDGTTFYGKVDAQGNRVRRSVKSVLLVSKSKS